MTDKGVKLNGPHFRFDDLKLDDLKEDNYVDPYYYIRRPIEPERLKLIYQNAFIYDLLYRFAKEYMDGQSTTQSKSDGETNKATDTEIDSIKQKVIEYLFKNSTTIEEETKSVKTPPKMVDCIWTEDDLNILRQNFSQIKEENQQLKSRLQVKVDENIELRRSLDKLQTETHLMPGQIKSLEKENERLYIRVCDLETRYESYVHEFGQIDKLVEQMKSHESELKSQINNLNSEKYKLEFELNKTRLKLDSLKNEVTIIFNEKLDNMKLGYLKEIRNLKVNLVDVEKAFEEERLKHDKCKKALEQLRLHFMTRLPAPTDSAAKLDESKIRIV